MDSKNNEDSVWVKIKKETSGGQNDIYIGTSYLSPTKGIAEKIAKLMEETSMFQAKRTCFDKWGL